jgi:hypothetical protein
MNQSELPPQLKRIQRNSIIVGVVGLIVAAGGAALNTEQFFQAYLLGYVFWMQLAIGCLGILLIHLLTGGQWGYTIRRFLETGAMTIPIMAVLFIPILIGMPWLYPWTNPELVAESHILSYKAGWWLNIPFFVGRTVLYFAIWIGVAYMLNRLSLQQDETGDPQINTRLKNLSAAGIIFSVLAATFAAYDWMMSTDPYWYSSMYGVIYMAGGAIFAIAGGILFVRYMSKRDEALNQQATIYIYNDLGNFLLAFVSFWAYVSFSQYLILWSANLPETITYYVIRLQGGWQILGVFLLGLGFFTPFLILLSRRNKRNIKVLIGLSIFLIVVRFVDLYWILLPTFSPDSLYVNWMSFFTVLGVGGIWMYFFLRNVKGKALLPLHDPRFQDSHHDESTHAASTKLQEAAAHE